MVSPHIEGMPAGRNGVGVIAGAIFLVFIIQLVFKEVSCRD